MAGGLQITRPRDGVLLLVLDRPDVLNAIDMALFDALSAALAEAEADDATRAIVITGAGDKAFSAGFDIHEMAGLDGAGMAAAFETRDPLFWRVANHPKPILTALNGLTYGAGALMAAAADLRLGCPATRFKVTASSYGAANATWSLPRIVGVPKAKEILLTGRVVPADEALAIGLLNHLVEADRLRGAALDMAAQIAANPPAGVMGVKSLMNAAIGRSLADAYTAEFDWMQGHMGPVATSGAAMFDTFLSKDGKKS